MIVTTNQKLQLNHHLSQLKGFGQKTVRFFSFQKHDNYASSKQLDDPAVRIQRQTQLADIQNQTAE
jgi:hypothetical protein